MTSPVFRFDFRAPAVRDLVAELLERPDVFAFQLDKPKAGEPVAVGVKLAHGWRWFHGKSLFAALMQANDALRRSGRVVDDG